MTATLQKFGYTVCCTHYNYGPAEKMQKVFFIGKLSGANRQEAADAVQTVGGQVANRLTADVDVIVVGEENILKQNWNLWNDQLDADTRNAFEKGTLTIISETQFWEKYALETAGQTIEQTSESPQTLYTSAMLAKLTGLPMPIIRRMHRERVIEPVRQVFRLAYFDKEVLLPLKIMQNMLAAEFTIPAAVKLLHKVGRRSSRQLSEARIEGKALIFSSEGGSVDINGQKFFSFAEETEPELSLQTLDPLAILDSLFSPEIVQNDPVLLCESACELEALGNLQGAADLYRAALAAGGANPSINFQLAEVLYRQGDLSAACERYFSAIELDENFVEARANLGCVLAELGRDDLAAAAFRGALRLHPDYAEVRFHLGMLLKKKGHSDEAEEQFQLFKELMPEMLTKMHL